jgi:hypothetical protein
MPCLHSNNKHFLRLQQNLVDFPQSLILLIFVTMITDGPDQCQTQVFLVNVLKTSFDLVDDVDGLHDTVVNFIKISLYYCLQRLNVFGFFYNLKNRAPPSFHNMTVINNNFVHCNCQLASYLLKLTPC